MSNEDAHMVDLDTPVNKILVESLQQTYVDNLGVFFDARVVRRVRDCIVDKVKQGVVEDGLVYRDLVGDSGVPSWIGHQGVLGAVLALVSLQSYEEDYILLSSLTRETTNQLPPTKEFCELLENLGLVRSREAQAECLEAWDYHWKKAISQVELHARSTKRSL
jgi:hypothetical protein